MEKGKKPFTIVFFEEDTGHIGTGTICAQDGLAAFGAMAKLHSAKNLTFVVAIEESPTGVPPLTFPGESLVDITTVLEQPDIFGSS